MIPTASPWATSKDTSRRAQIDALSSVGLCPAEGAEAVHQAFPQRTERVVLAEAVTFADPVDVDGGNRHGLDHIGEEPLDAAEVDRARNQ